MKKALSKEIVKLIYILSLVVFLVPVVSAEPEFVSVVSDGFENSWNGGDGWLGEWYHQGDSAIVSDDPYEGSYSLRLGRKNGYVDRMTGLSQYSNAKLTFYAKVQGYSGSVFSDLLYSSDGLNWVVLRKFTASDSDNRYNYYEIDLKPYGLNENVWIAIDSEGSKSDYLYIDNINIVTSDDVTPPEPAPQPSWHIQYNPTPVNPEADVEYWNLDLFDVDNNTMAGLKSQGVFVMCYFSAGSFEEWRSDEGDFPSEVLGKSNGWPGEKWLDISDPRVLDIMKNRMGLGINKGCDGFDPDNMDGYSNITGFPLTEQDYIDYYNALAEYAHDNGKQIGLKNALTIIDDVLENIDWAVNEQCFYYNECFYLDSVLNIGKPVFNIEYGDGSKAEEVCDIANERGFTTLIKNMQLNEFEISCLDWDGSVPPDKCTTDEWNPGKTYFKRDIVSHNNHEWKAKNSSQGVEHGTSKRYWTDIGPCN